MNEPTKIKDPWESRGQRMWTCRTCKKHYQTKKLCIQHMMREGHE